MLNLFCRKGQRPGEEWKILDQTARFNFVFTGRVSMSDLTMGVGGNSLFFVYLCIGNRVSE